MTARDEAAWLMGYMPLVVRAPGLSDWERKFCASVIAAERKGRKPTEKQIGVMRRLVDRFREAALRDDVVERRE